MKFGYVIFKIFERTDIETRWSQYFRPFPCAN